jgi:hypothetical protein
MRNPTNGTAAKRECRTARFLAPARTPLVVTLAASVVPALRILRLDPAATLRNV